MKKERIHLSLPKMSGREQFYIQQAFDSSWVVPLGPNVDGFEHDLEHFLGQECFPVALSSGTAALHLGLILVGIKPEDEVICQTFTFAASANPITYVNATPVFVDSEPDSWNICPELLEEAVKDRIRITGKVPSAIIPVHLFGMPARMDKILAIAQYYGIPVLEDAAEALGSEYQGARCGTFGNMACLSFNGNKMITTSGGGALVCHTPEEAAKARFYATQARDAAPHYQHSRIGYNYRMSNICAGIGRGQMTVVGDFIARRREIHRIYREKLSGLPGISLLEDPSGEFASNHWLTCVQVDPERAGYTREDLRLTMDEENIETRPLWKPMHLQPVYAGAPFYGNGIAADLFEKGLCLPSGPVVTNDDLDRIVEVFGRMEGKGGR